MSKLQREISSCMPECMMPDGAEPCAGYMFLLERANAIEAQQQWVPVSERLPEEGVPVLVVGNPWPDQIRTALIAFDEGWHWEVMTSCFALSDPAAYEFDDDYEFTHWMPLPAPPQEETSK